jgi:outer membrane protein assembly factor BamB
VTAYGLANGKELWSVKVTNATPEESSNYVSKAAPTPAADTDGLICLFEGGNLVALSHDGQIRWKRNLVEDYGELVARHGLSASVEQDESSVYLWLERSEDPYVLSVDKRTGKTNWKAEGVGATSWASPRLVPVPGGRHLVLSAVGSLLGLDPETGRKLWRMDDVTGNSTPTPIPLGDGRFLIGATVGRGGESGEGRAAESNGVVAITPTADGGWQADYQWRAKRATSSFGSPIAHNGMAYFVNRTGVLYGLDLETGDERFAKRLSGSTWATPLGVGNRVFFFSRDGRVSMTSGDRDDPDVVTWEGLPADPKPANASEQSPFSGSVLYAASLSDALVVLRRGDRLFAVPTTGQPPMRRPPSKNER